MRIGSRRLSGSRWEWGGVCAVAFLGTAVLLTTGRVNAQADTPASEPVVSVTTKPSAGNAAKTPAALAVSRTIHTRATWYGPGFHGRRTANGERFNRHALTLASRHLPFGTKVRVVNPKNGRSVIARVNDRGPFGSRAVTADLSQAVARRIGLGGSGPVRLEILKANRKPAGK